MSKLKTIRQSLGVTQKVLATAMGCGQSNITFYEAGRSIPEPRAKLLIAFANQRGMMLTFDHVYGESPVPEKVVS